MYTLLLVEDEAMELLALKYAITTNYDGMFQIIEAADGDTALDLCQKYHPELIIADINIPGITGLDLIESVNKLNFDTAILISTAYDKSGYIRRALEMGVLSYLLKPIDVRELKLAIQKCIQRLEEHRSQEKQMASLMHGIESVRSYAKEYLVRDILEGNAPAEVLSSACGWPSDGSLQICLLCWIPSDTPDYDLFYEVCEQQFRGRFSLLFSPLNGCGLLLLQSCPNQEQESLMLFLRLGAIHILRAMGHGKIAGSNFFTSYDTLSGEWEDFYSSALNLKAEYSFPPISMRALGSSHQRILLRQKILQRLQNRRISPVISLLKKTVCSSNSYWQTAALFFHALWRFDQSICLTEIFELCEQDRSWKKMAKWLENYYHMHPPFSSQDQAARSHIQKALALMEQNYSQDLTMAGIAEELGLSATYFSNLFKQQTGKNFVSVFHEIRIRHAITMMEQEKQSIEKIASQCGYCSKKYFFEAFKRTTGQSVTQYRQGEIK